MADRTISPNIIALNSILFPIDGLVRETSISRFPAAMRVGSPDYANEQILSNWIINDQRGGLLIEEMDESVHQDRYWWSTCETRVRSNLLLPPLATAISLSTAITSVRFRLKNNDVASQNADFHECAVRKQSDQTWNTPTSVGSSTGWTNPTNAIDGDTGTFARVSGLGSGIWTNWLQLDIASITIDAVRYYYSIGGATAPDIDIDVYQGGAWRNYIQGTAGTEAAWVNVLIGDVAIGSATVMVEFNSNVYLAIGKALLKLNSTENGFALIDAGFSANISDLIVSNDNNLLIYQGDSENYWYMTTGEVLTQTNVALANLGLRWDGKTWKMAVNGRWWYSTAPGSATPTWTAGDASGGLDDYGLTPKSLAVYFDANGNQLPYCATTKGLYDYDQTNSKWIETALELPQHARTGLGMVVWHDALFISAGLSVNKYIAGTTATITSMGLDKDDGLPQLRSGEIVKFIKGYNEFFALVDSTYEGTGSRSQVVSYDGRGWRTWWEATADNKNMYAGIVSSSPTNHKLLFSTTDGVYLISLQRTSLNPKKVSGYTYAAAGIHITPRFDAGTKAFPKLATKLTLFLDDMSANETVAVTYQIDQAQGALTSAWTTLVAAQTADGKVEQTFGTSGVGIVFFDIQFRLALARAAGTNTNSPIIKGMVLSYLKLLGIKKAWSFTINTAEAGRVSSDAKTLVGNITTLLALNTLMPFTHRSGDATADTHYVFVSPYSGATPAGRNFEGTYSLTVIEP